MPPETKAKRVTSERRRLSQRRRSKYHWIRYWIGYFGIAELLNRLTPAPEADPDGTTPTQAGSGGQRAPQEALRRLLSPPGVGGRTPPR